MTEVKDFEIVKVDGDEYKIILLSTSRGLATSKAIIKLALPTVGAGADGLFNESILDDSQTFAQMAMLLISQLDEVDIEALIKELLQGTTANNVPIDFDQHFKGRFDVLVNLLEGALRANYGSLFTEMSWSKKLKELIPQLNPTQVPMTENEEDQ